MTTAFSIPDVLDCDMAYVDINITNPWEQFGFQYQSQLSKKEKNICIGRLRLKPTTKQDNTVVCRPELLSMTDKLKYGVLINNQVNPPYRYLKIKNPIISNLQIIGIDNNSHLNQNPKVFVKTADGIVFSVNQSLVVEAAMDKSLVDGFLTKEYTFIHSTSTGTFLVPTDSSVYTKTKQEYEFSSLKYEDYKSGYIYKTPGETYSLFLGHASTIRFSAIGQKKSSTEISGNWNNKTSIPHTKLMKLFKSNIRKNFKSFDYDIRFETKFVEYGTLWLDIEMPTYKVQKSVDLIDYISTYVSNKLSSVDYFTIKSIKFRSNPSFTRIAFDKRFDVSYEDVLTKTRTKAAKSVQNAKKWFPSNDKSHLMLRLLCPPILDKVCLCNITPLGVYPQINSCFSDYEHLIIKPESR